MALRLRRGTDTERQLITPVEGELVYVTDTKELFIGDGTTVGGIRVTGEVADTLTGLSDVDAALPQDGDTLIYDTITGNWIAAELPLGDLSNVSTAGIVDGQVLAWDAETSAFIPATVQGVGGVIEVDRVNSNLIPIVGINAGIGAYDARWEEGFFVNLDLSGRIYGQDSTVMLDTNNSTFTGNIEVNRVNSNLIPIVGINAGIGAYDARWEEGFFVNLDISGGIVGQDSALVYSANNNTFSANFDGNLIGSVFGDDSTQIVDGILNTVNASKVTTREFETDSSTFKFSTSDSLNPQLTAEIASIEETPAFAFTRYSDIDTSGSNDIYGRLLFTRNDANGSFTSSLVSGARDYLALFNDPAGDAFDPTKFVILTNGRLSVGAGGSPTATLDVNGAIKPGVYADATARDTAIDSPVEGMLVFLQDTQKFVGYVSDTGLAGGGVSNSTAGWVDLY